MKVAAVWLLAMTAAAQTTVRFESPAGTPVLFETTLPRDIDPDSVRVFAGETSLPLKVDWRRPNARISWVSTGPGSYRIEVGEQSAEAAGAGDDRNGRPGDVRDGRGAGTACGWAVGASGGDRPGRGREGRFDRRMPGPAVQRDVLLPQYRVERLSHCSPGRSGSGRGVKDLVAADFNGDGAIDLVISGGYFSDVRRNRMSRFVPVKLNRSYTVGRDDLWYPVDWDHDGKIDVLAGVSDWTEYGWDDAFDASGKWTRGPLHGYVYFHRNVGTNEEPSYAARRGSRGSTPTAVRRRTRWTGSARGSWTCCSGASSTTSRCSGMAGIGRSGCRSASISV